MVNMEISAKTRMQKEIEKQQYRALRSSSIIATTMLGLYGVFILVLLIIERIPPTEIGIYVVIFIGVLASNALAIFNRWSLKTLILLSALNVGFIYTFITYLIFNQSLPGILANLFVAFTIGFIYLDTRIVSINHFLMTLTSSLVIWIFPETLALVDPMNSQLLVINLSIVLIMGFLFVSAVFNNRAKNFNYIKLAKSKENEYRIMDSLFELQNEMMNGPIDRDVFYHDIELFFESFTSKLEMENIFAKRLELIKDIERLTDKQLVKKYKDIPFEIISELKNLSLNSKQKIRYLAYRISQISDHNNRSLNSQNAFNSFRHYDDSDTVKIMIFSAFYIYFRHQDVDREKMDTEAFIRWLKKSGLDDLVEPKILSSFYAYKDVIQTIVDEAMSGVEVAL